MSRYDDIIGRKYEGSTTRPRMSLTNRAAQFAPFAALTGHDAAINETARLTEERMELSAEEQRDLSARLNHVLNRIEEMPVLTFTVYQPDKRKSGGHYEEISGTVKKYDEYEKSIILTNNNVIAIEDLISIGGAIFNDSFE
ncbi:MAG: hypothetical protein NC328_08400 [Muribaculum sp.]|nr:hypothetical protein [Muribaculum sp.]